MACISLVKWNVVLGVCAGKSRAGRRDSQAVAIVAAGCVINRVYIAKGGGHVWNFVKDGQHLNLIDISMRLFRVVTK